MTHVDRDPATVVNEEGVKNNYRGLLGDLINRGREVV